VLSRLEDKLPVNVPQLTSRLFLEYVLPWPKGLFVNAGLNVDGSRYVDALHTDQLDTSVTFDAGVRYQLRVLHHDPKLEYYTRAGITAIVSHSTTRVRTQAFDKLESAEFPKRLAAVDMPV